MEDTTDRSLSRSELNKVDLPVLGLPIKTMEFSLLTELSSILLFVIFFEIPLLNSSVPIL